jgi:F420-dependent oxidoreductase-like protein
MILSEWGRVASASGEGNRSRKRRDDPVKLGLQLNSFDWTGGAERYRATLTEIARTAEDAGFDRIGVADHVWQHPMMGGPEANEPECYTTLAFLAAYTERVGLGAMVSGVHFRYPAVLVKAVTTLDALSGGRAWLGIGSGHYEEETRGLGIPFPAQRVRFEMLEEAIQIALRMWSGEHGDERPFEGKHYHLERLLNLPQSLTRPHPPIMIAGDGEKKTLRLVARYADVCSLRPSPEILRKLDVLRRHCEEEGRDYEEIEKTCAFAFDVGERGKKAGELIGQLRWLAGMGVETVIGMVPNVDRISPIEVIGSEVIPAVADV